MTTGRKLAIGGALVIVVTAYMAYVGASTSWQYYLTVDECLAGTPALGGERVRISGKVARNSLKATADGKQTSFRLEGTKGSLRVICSEPVPDNLAEKVDVVVEGHLEDRSLFVADKVLTRCAGKYTSQRSGDPSPREDRTGEGNET